MRVGQRIGRRHERLAPPVRELGRCPVVQREPVKASEHAVASLNWAFQGHSGG